jgi:nucleotide-binding universal stress UspA family protein
MTKIIVGIDGSERSEDAIAFARDLVDATGVDVVLACAYPYAPVPSRVSGAQIRQYLAADAEATLTRMRAGLEGAETEAIADPSPARALHELAQREQAALIVVGSSHHSKLGSALIGSTAMRLLQGSPCAVAVVPRGYAAAGAQRIARIGCAFDFSDEAQTALDVAVSAAQRLLGVLRVISVYNINDYPFPLIGYAPVPADDLRVSARAAKERLDKVVDALPESARAEATFIQGVAAPTLIEQSEQLDLLFTGSRGYGPHRAVLSGSVTDELLTGAKCPVIVLPRGDALVPLEGVFSAAPEVSSGTR